MELLGLQRICPICQKNFSFCEKCWRGHKYCGPLCSREGRKKNRRNAERRYAASPKGRESRRRRQKNFRIRKILQLKVTDRSPRKNQTIIRPTPNTGSQTERCCCRCEKLIHTVVKKGPDAFSSSNYFSFTRFRSQTYDASF